MLELRNKAEEPVGIVGADKNLRSAVGKDGRDKGERSPAIQPAQTGEQSMSRHGVRPLTGEKQSGRSPIRVVGGVGLTGLMLISLATDSRTSQAAQQTQRPIKLYVGAEKVTEVGIAAGVRVTLWNTNNRPVPASKDYAVRVEVTPPSGRSTSIDYLIRSSSSSAYRLIPMNQTGIVRIRATHPELLDGGAYILVRPKRKPSRAPARPKPTSGKRATRRIQHPLPPFADVSLAGFTIRGPYRALEYAGIAPSAGTDTEPRLVLLPSAAGREVLADGKDFWTIQAFLDGPAAVSDILIGMYHDKGTLDPEHIIIPKGQYTGHSRLVCRDTGTVTVEYQFSKPRIQLADNTKKKLQVGFSPPIVGLHLQSSTSSCSILEAPTLVVRFVNEGKRYIPTDRPREVTFTMAGKGAKIDPLSITIPANQSRGETTLLPAVVGPVKITASTDHLPPSDVLEVNVEGLPPQLAGLSILGALLGSLLAFWTSNERRWWRIILGLITGILLYWAYVFGVLLLPRFHGNLLNPLTALFVSLLGGWLGDKVFGWISQAVGLGRGDRPEAPPPAPVRDG